MGEKEREDKNRSTTGASRPRLDLGTSKLGSRNSSMKQKQQISKREFSMNDMLSQKSTKLNMEDSIGVVGAPLNQRRPKHQNVSQTKPVAKTTNKSPDV
jgi:hypothetical protein